MSVIHSTDVLLPRNFKVLSRTRSSDLQPAGIVLLAVLMAAPWAFGAVDAWAWTCLGLGAALTIFLWAAGCVRRHILRFTWSPLYAPLVIFFILGVCEYLVGHTLDKSETRQALVLLATDLAFFFTATQVFSDGAGESRRWLGLTVLLFAGTLGLFAIVQFAAGAPGIFWTFDTSGSFFGPYVNPDHFAGLMEMLVPVGICYIGGQRKKYSGAALLMLMVAAAVAVASLLLTGSRGGLLALCVEITVAGVMFRRRARSVNRWGLAGSLAGAAFAVLLLFSWIDPGWVAERLGAVFDLDGQKWVETTEFRRRVSMDSLCMLRDHPAFGVGLGNFELSYPPYQSFPSDLTIDYAHNDYAQAAAETGLVGAALILSALVLFLRLAFSGLRHRLEAGHGWIQLGAALGCCGLLVHSLVDFNLHIPANAVWFAVLAGIAACQGDISHLPHERYQQAM